MKWESKSIVRQTRRRQKRCYLWRKWQTAALTSYTHVGVQTRDFPKAHHLGILPSESLMVRCLLDLAILYLCWIQEVLNCSHWVMHLVKTRQPTPGCLIIRYEGEEHVIFYRKFPVHIYLCLYIRTFVLKSIILDRLYIGYILLSWVY